MSLPHVVGETRFGLSGYVTHVNRDEGMTIFFGLVLTSRHFSASQAVTRHRTWRAFSFFGNQLAATHQYQTNRINSIISLPSTPRQNCETMRVDGQVSCLLDCIHLNMSFMVFVESAFPIAAALNHDNGVTQKIACDVTCPFHVHTIKN